MNYLKRLIFDFFTRSFLIIIMIFYMKVTTENGDTFLASMPTRFRRNVWIKRGDYVVIEKIEEGVKVQGEIARILYKDHVAQLKKDGIWPEAFTEKNEETKEKSDSQDEDSDGDLFVNTNRRQPVEQSESSSEEDSEEGD
jgi:probable RNA-binding protein EIF1AD